MHILKYRARVAGAAIALGLVASACGADAESSVDAAAPVDAAADVAEGGSSDAQPESEDASAGDQDEAPVADHLFPDVETVNIVDGSTLNLADELAGGDTPILLWFWAPH